MGHEQRAAQRLHMDTRGPRPNSQEARPPGSQNKEEARLMAQLSKETLLLSWVQSFTRILGRVTDTEQISKEEKFARKKYMGLCSAGSSLVSIIMRLFPVKIMM